MRDAITWAAAAAAGLVLLAGCAGPRDAATVEPAAARTARAPVSVTLSVDESSDDRVRATRRGGRLVGQAMLGGRAQPMSILRVGSGCRRDGCVTSATAGRDGRWRASVRVTASPRRPYARVVASLADQSALTLVHLQGPRRRPAASSGRRDRGAPRPARPDGRRGSAPVARPPSPSPSPSPSPLPSATLAPLPPADGITESGPTGADAPQVLVVGDSLEVATSPYLQRHLPSVRLTVNAQGGYSSLQIFDLFEDSYAPAQSVVVFDAGTNDNPAYPQILDGRLRAVAQMVGDRCLVVPTIHGLEVNGIDDTGKNRVIARFAASRPGTQTPDWAGLATTRPELLQSDRLHPTPAGADARAQLVAQGVTACLADRAGRGA